jgi:general secretion pathway protein I
MRLHGWGMERADRKELCSRAVLHSPRSKGRDRASPGFTLLEVMVAVAILAMVVVSLLGLRNRSIEDVQLAERITTATLLAKRVMAETLLPDTKLAPMEDAGTFDDERFQDYSWKKVISETQIPVILEVRVAVLWKEGAREEQVELVSYE